MTPAPNNYKYPDGIILTLKSSNHADHFFVERAFALQLANSIKDSLSSKKGKTKPKPAENKPSKSQKKTITRGKPRAD
jgi:hypothetical protein